MKLELLKKTGVLFFLLILGICSVFGKEENVPPTSPVLRSPADNSWLSLPITFIWDKGSGADNHRIEIDNNDNFEDGVVENIPLPPENDNWYVVDNLPPGTYYWRVVAVNAYGENWSETWVFNVAIWRLQESMELAQRTYLLKLYFVKDGKPLSNVLIEYRVENSLKYEDLAQTDNEGCLLFMKENENLVSLLQGKKVYFRFREFEGSALIENKPEVLIQMVPPHVFPIWLVTFGILAVGAGVGFLSMRKWALKRPKVAKVVEKKPPEEAVTILKPPPPPPFAGFKTDVGRVRTLNEDSLWLEDFSKDGNLRVLAMVADGMGGHAKGEVASRICVQTVVDFLRPVLEKGKSDYSEDIRQALSKANEEILAYALDHPEAQGMGTTVSVVVIDGNSLYVGHVGDTRVYVINGGIKQITKDHSLVQELIDRGEIKPEEARTHPQRNVVTRAVGVKRRLEVDTYSCTLSMGGYVLVCCDGLVNELEDEEIRKIVLESEKAQEACNRLVELANKRGGRDNISVVIVGPLKPAEKDTIIKKRVQR
jgi:protein phosphatase